MRSTRPERLLLLAVGLALGVAGGVPTQLGAIALLGLMGLATFLLLLPRRRRPLTRGELQAAVEDYVAHEKRKLGEP